MAQAAFEMRAISKSFFGTYALRDVNFRLEQGSILGLIGENGAGKSTMMNIIGGVHIPDGGEMRLNGQLYEPKSPMDAMNNKIAFVHQELNLFTNLSIADNMFLEDYPRGVLIKTKEMKKRTQEILKMVELDISVDTLVERLSPGQRQLVEIAKCLKTDPDIIIFDEPTTSLTAHESRKLFEIIRRLNGKGKSIIYISHILSDVKSLTDKIVVLRDGHVTTSGDTKDFEIDKMIKFMVGRELTQIYPTRKSKPGSEVVLKAENISEPGISHKISLELHKGEILGLFGLMGSGRSELLRILYGLDAHSEGEVYIKGKKVTKGSPRHSIENNIGFITEDRKGEGLLLNFNIEENMALVSLPKFSSRRMRVINAKKQEEPIQKYLDRLKIRTGNIRQQTAKSLSGGNQQKVVIAKWLIAEPEILFVDEPTRGIDVGTKYEVYCILNDLAAQGKSILMVSSEIEELMGVCDRIIVMSLGEVLSEFSMSEFDTQKVLASAFRQTVVKE